MMIFTSVVKSTHSQDNNKRIKLGDFFGLGNIGKNVSFRRDKKKEKEKNKKENRITEFRKELD